MGDVDTRCPACGARVGGAETCSSCGLELNGPHAVHIRSLAGQLRALDGQIDTISTRRQQVAVDLDRLRLEVRDVGRQWEPPEASPWKRTRPELNLEGVRNVLLALGTTLLALAALAFTAVAWTRMSDAGRAVLLGGVTAAAAALARMLRRRLPATAEALGGLAIALASIDWYALRRAGVGAGISGPAWWAAGTATVSGFAFAFVRSSAPRVSRFALVTLVPATAVLIVTTVAGAAWSIGLGLALVAAAMVAIRVARSGDTRVGLATGLLEAEAALVWSAAAGASIVAATEPTQFVATMLPALAVLALGLAPAVRVAATPRIEGATLPAAFVAASAMGAALTLFAASVDAAGLLLVSALLALAAIAAAGWVNEQWWRGVLLAGCSALAPGLAWAAAAATVASTAPLAWLNAAWSGDTSQTAREVVAGPSTSDPLTVGWVPVGILLAGVVAVVLAATCAPRRRQLLRSNGAVAAAALGLGLAVNLGAVTGGCTVAIAAASTTAAACTLLVASAVIGRWWPHHALGVAGAALPPAVAATGWASTSAVASVAALAFLVLSAMVAVSIGRAEPLRTLHLATTAGAACTLAGIATIAAADNASTTGVVLTITAVTVAAAGALMHRASPDTIACEAVGVAGLTIGLAFSASDAVAFAVAATVAVPILLVGALPHHRRTAYGIAAGVSALAASWAWLAVMDVRLVEAYTLPAALVALLVGALGRKSGPARSLLTLGPTLTIAVGPTLAIALRDDDVTRAVCVGIAAFAMVLVGAQRRLQAPLMIGAAALVALGVDALGPAAADLPRWVVLAVPGAVLLWVGATFERRRESLRDAAHAFTRFG